MYDVNAHHKTIMEYARFINKLFKYGQTDGTRPRSLARIMSCAISLLVYISTYRTDNDGDNNG